MAKFYPSDLGKIPEGGNSGQVLSKVDNENYNAAWTNVSALFSELPGPFTNEANAAAAGVPLGSAYYDNGGTVRVRLS